MLFVCEGNVCRSPAAQLLLAAALPASLVQPASAGLGARVGETVAPDTSRLLRSRGVDTAGFRARSIDDTMLAMADLVVVMTTAQRSAVVRRAPAAMQRTWTLLDLAGTVHATGVSVSRGHDAMLKARSGGLGDVPDPWGRGQAAHRKSFGIIADAVERLVPAFR